jgi:hypothetical protein
MVEVEQAISMNSENTVYVADSVVSFWCRDLYSGVNTLKVVSSELNYIDRITEIAPPKSGS